MHHAAKPALAPAALFVAGLLASDCLTPVPLGLAIVGAALAAALRRPALAALFAGVALHALQPPSAFATVDRGKTVEIVGRVAGAWRIDPSGARAALEPAAVIQDGRVELAAPPIAIDLAAGVEPPATGSRVRVRGALRRAPGYANERSTGPGRFRLRVKSPYFIAVEAPPSRLDRAAAAARERIEREFRAASPRHRGVAFAGALLFGDLESMPERDERAFRRSGLAHLLAASGMNVALAVACVAIGGAFLPRRWHLVLTACAVTLHLLVVGPAPSLVRASAMAAIALAARALARPPHPLQSLALAVAVLLAASPAMVGDIGFALSCAATLGIVALAPAIAARWGRGPRWLRLALATSLAAQIVTLPLSVAAFSSLTPASPLLNLLFVPLASLLLVGAFAWALAAIALPWLALPLAWALDALAWPFALLDRIPAGPWLSLPNEGTLAAGLAASAALALLTVGGSRLRRLTLVALAALAAGHGLPTAERFELVMADVGQGDGMLLRVGERALLIDGGGAAGRDLAAQVWLPLLARRGITSLEAIVATHGDLDHCGGLVDIAAHVPVEAIWTPVQLAESRCVRELEFWSGARLRGLAAGDRLNVGGADFEVLSPRRRERPPDGRTSNALSLVAIVSAGGRRLLLTGDLDGEAEARLVAFQGSALACDVLKVGHHGSARGTGAHLLAAARPRLAIVSAGPGNRFGHPAPEVLERLAERHIPLLRTDVNGEIDLAWSAGTPLRIALPGAPRAPL